MLFFMYFLYRLINVLIPFNGSALPYFNLSSFFRNQCLSEDVPFLHVDSCFLHEVFPMWSICFLFFFIHASCGGLPLFFIFCIVVCLLLRHLIFSWHFCIIVIMCDVMLNNPNSFFYEVFLSLVILVRFQFFSKRQIIVR